MRNFSFFSRWKGPVSNIRGVQVAEALGGRFEPASGYEDDICVYIIGAYGIPEPRWSYYDVLDSKPRLMWNLRRRTRGAIISTSKTHREEMAKMFPGREVHLIPQHHCNLERARRERDEVRVVGCIGGYSAVQWPFESLALECRQRGLEWKFSADFSTREKVVEFYKSIDVHLSFRPTSTRFPHLLFHNCLKLANAGSFGIPTIAFPEPAYLAEWKDECLWSTSITELLDLAKKLKDTPGLYVEMSEKARVRAEEYHMDKVVGLYRSLPGAEG